MTADNKKMTPIRYIYSQPRGRGHRTRHRATWVLHLGTEGTIRGMGVRLCSNKKRGASWFPQDAVIGLFCIIHRLSGDRHLILRDEKVPRPVPWVRRAVWPASGQTGEESLQGHSSGPSQLYQMSR